MADVALGIAGGVVGGIVAGPQGALTGFSAGLTAGGLLFGPRQKTQHLGKLDDAQRVVSGSAYGAPIPIVYGTRTVPGNVIWATDLEETSQPVRSGGKGTRRRTNKKYIYKGDFAVLFSRGVKNIKRIWAEDILIYDEAQGGALDNHVIRTYDGTESQTKDTLIASIEGAANTPAYRGLTYAVLEDLLLEQWGNRPPAAIRAEVEPLGGGGEFLDDVLADILGQVGLTSADWDLDAGSTTTVEGYVLEQRTTAREAVEPLLLAFGFLLVEVDGLLKLTPLDGSVLGTVPAEDLGGAVWQPDRALPKLRGRVRDDLDKPVHVDLNYLGRADRNYEQLTESAERFTKTDLQNPLTVGIPVVMGQDFAARLARRLLYEQWLHGEQFTVPLRPVAGLQIAPGDLWRVPVNGSLATVRVVKVDLPLPIGPVSVEAVLYRNDVLTQVATGAGLNDVDDFPSEAEDTKLLTWSDNPLLDAHADAVGLYLAANADGAGDWIGCQVYWSRDGGATYQELRELVDPATWGTTDDTLAAPPATVGTAIWDDVSTVDVTIETGSPPVTLTDLEVLNGANAVRFESGEVVQFAVVTALGGDSYRLSRLLRGRQGTDAYWGDHFTGEEVTFLNAGTYEHVALTEDLVGKVIKLKAVTFGQAIGAVAAVDLTITGNELKPWSGTDGRGTRDVPATNDWTIEWKRRTRKGGAWADFADAQLHDTPEGYEAEIYSDGTYTVLERTVTGLTSPTFVYTEAEQVADFGAAQATVFVRVFQLGRFGRGYPYDFSVTDP